MAIDSYLQIDNIKGESQDSKHKDWIEIINVQWDVHQSRIVSNSSSGHTSGKAELSEITFKKLADLSSPILQQTCASGKTIPKAKFEFMRADGNGEPIKYYTVEIENVIIASVSPSSTEGGLITERVSLGYSKIKWGYIQQKIAGGASGQTSGGWDLATNKIAS